MMTNNDNPLYAQKVTILSRLIKESSLTLEEALILLKEEEPEEEPAIVSPTIPNFNPGTTTPWIQPYGSGTVPLTGSGITWITTTNTASVDPVFTTGSSSDVDLNN